MSDSERLSAPLVALAHAPSARKVGGASSPELSLGVLHWADGVGSALVQEGLCRLGVGSQVSVLPVDAAAAAC